MRGFLALSFILSCLLSSGCSRTANVENTRDRELSKAPQIKGLEREIYALGHKNWIVVADQSFPVHSRRGVRNLLVGAEIPDVVNQVVDIIHAQQHLVPKFYQAYEVNFVKNDASPGIDAFRQRLGESLHGFELNYLQQESLSVLLEDSSKSFAVLVLKTTTALPYSAVFIELGSGYWDGMREGTLRNEIEQELNRQQVVQ